MPTTRANVDVHNVTGFLAESKSDFLNAVYTLCDKPSLIHEMGQAGMNRIKTLFPVTRPADCFSEILKNVSSLPPESPAFNTHPSLLSAFLFSSLPHKLATEIVFTSNEDDLVDNIIAAYSQYPELRPSNQLPHKGTPYQYRYFFPDYTPFNQICEFLDKYLSYS